MKIVRLQTFEARTRKRDEEETDKKILTTFVRNENSVMYPDIKTSHLFFQ